MTEFQAYEHTDINSAAAWNAEPVLRHVRRHYGHLAWWKTVLWSSDVPGSLLTARAARAAEHQGRARSDAVLRRLRAVTFVDQRPITELTHLRTVMASVPGVDVERLIRDLESPDVTWSVDANHALILRRGGGAQPCAFPTMFFRGPRGDRLVSGDQRFEVYVEAIEAVAPSVHVLAQAG